MVVLVVVVLILIHLKVLPDLVHLYVTPETFFIASDFVHFVPTIFRLLCALDLAEALPANCAGLIATKPLETRTQAKINAGLLRIAKV